MVSHYYPINPHMSVSSTVQRDRGHNRHVQVMRPPQPMCRSNSRSPPPPITTTKTTSNSVVYAQQQLGVSLSEGLEKAYSECKAKVERIAAQCRLKNRKFRYKLLLCFFPYPWPNTHCTQLFLHRDVEFDLENDASRCLHNLTENNLFVTSDVRRVPDIFKDPVFFSGTPKSAEIIQGAVEDCYLVSALSTMTSIERLISNLCVAVSTPLLDYSFFGCFCGLSDRSFVAR